MIMIIIIMIRGGSTSGSSIFNTLGVIENTIIVLIEEKAWKTNRLDKLLIYANHSLSMTGR